MGSRNTKSKKISISNDINVDNLDQSPNANSKDTGLIHATNDRRRLSNFSNGSQNSNGNGKMTGNQSDTSDQHDSDYPPMSPAIISTTHLNDTKPDPSAAKEAATRIIYVNAVRHSSLPAYPVDGSAHDKENNDPTSATTAPKRLVPILVNNHNNDAKSKGHGLLSNGKDGGGLRMLPIIARRRSVATSKILQKDQIDNDLETRNQSNRPPRTAKGVRFSEQVITIDHSPFPQPDLDDTQLSNDDYYPNEHYMRRRSSLKEGAYLLKKPLEEVVEDVGGNTNNTTNNSSGDQASSNKADSTTNSTNTSENNNSSDKDDDLSVAL